MPLSSHDDDLLAEIYRNLRDEPIQPGHRFYVEIWENSDHDPVRRLHKHIRWS